MSAKINFEFLELPLNEDFKIERAWYLKTHPFEPQSGAPIRQGTRIMSDSKVIHHRDPQKVKSP